MRPPNELNSSDSGAVVTGESGNEEVSPPLFAAEGDSKTVPFTVMEHGVAAGEQVAGSQTIVVVW